MIPKLPPHFLATVLTYVHDRCHLCGANAYLGRRQLICHHCQNLITPPPTFVIDADKPIPLSVCTHYDTPFDDVMSSYKNHENISALMVLYQLLRTLPKPNNLNDKNAVIIPTPTTKNRLIKRGFNPALTLAKYLSYHWQIPLLDTLQRHENDTHQRGLGRDERLVNVKNDFYFTQYPTARYVIIFDDVITTGATISAIANLLINKSSTQHIMAVGVMHGKADLHLRYNNH